MNLDLYMNIVYIISFKYACLYYRRVCFVSLSPDEISSTAYSDICHKGWVVADTSKSNKICCVTNYWPIWVNDDHIMEPIRTLFTSVQLKCLQNCYIFKFHRILLKIEQKITHTPICMHVHGLFSNAYEQTNQTLPLKNEDSWTELCEEK